MRQLRNGMTAAPRYRALVPVGDHVGVDAERFGHHRVATKGFDQLLVHGPLSQIVNADASEKCHSLCVARFFPASQSHRMEQDDKNGGPIHLRAWRTLRGLSAKWLRRLAPALDTTPGMLLDHDPAELDSDILDIWGTASTREKRQISEIARALIKTGTGG